MDIYWIENGKRKGPITVPDIISLVQMGELTPQTKGWHAGCEQWMPLCELPALADFLSDTEEKSTHPQAEEVSATDAASAPIQLPPSEKQQPVPQVSSQEPAATPRILEVFPAPPFARLMARLVDTSLYAALVLGVIYCLKLEYNNYYTPGGLIFWLPLPIVEALLLSRFGTTPGKLLMGIRLAALIGTPGISFKRALLRSALVFFLGMGLMMFPVGLVMMLFSYWNLRSRGICLWDARAATMPVQPNKNGFGRFATAAITIYMALTAAGLFMQPWMPTLLNEIEKQSPDAARQLRDLMQMSMPANEQQETDTIPQPGD